MIATGTSATRGIIGSVAGLVLATRTSGAIALRSRAAVVTGAHVGFGTVEITALIVAGMAGIMTSAITAVDGRTLVVEEFVVDIASTQGEREAVAAHPNHGTIEVYSLGVAIPLPGAEDVTEVGVAAHPIYAIKIRPIVESKHIVEVDFIDSLVLREAEVELIGHLIRKEEGFLASLGVAHGCGRGNYRHHQDQGHH
jgi:hypothetical protein